MRLSPNQQEYLQNYKLSGLPLIALAGRLLARLQVCANLPANIIIDSDKDGKPITSQNPHLHISFSYTRQAAFSLICFSRQPDFRAVIDAEDLASDDYIEAMRSFFIRLYPDFKESLLKKSGWQIIRLWTFYESHIKICDNVKQSLSTIKDKFLLKDTPHNYLRQIFPFCGHFVCMASNYDIFRSAIVFNLWDWKDM